ncbi:MAG: glycosyltransferase family 4 protein [Fimbriimonas sp.]
MHILILTTFYPPEPLKLIAELAEGCREHDWVVTVMTGYPNWPKGKLYAGYKNGRCREEEINGVRVIRVPCFPDHSRSRFKRSLSYGTLAVSMAVYHRKVGERPDLIYVWSQPTNGLAAWILSRLWRIPFVLDVQDLWPESLVATGMVSRPRVLRMVDRGAKWLYRQSAGIRAISPGIRKTLIAKGASSSKVAVIPNWVDTAQTRPLEPDPSLLGEMGEFGGFRVVYAGNLGLAQGIQTLLDAAKILKVNPNVRFYLFGSGVDAPMLHDFATQNGLDNVKFMGRYPETEMSRVFSTADALVLLLKDTPPFDITIPHKLYYYLASGKPVVGSIRGDAATIILDSGAGVVCRPNDPDKLAAAILRLQQMPASERKEMGLRGWREACERFDRKVVGQVVDQFLKSVLGGNL